MILMPLNNIRINPRQNEPVGDFVFYKYSNEEENLKFPNLLTKLEKSAIIITLCETNYYGT